MDNRDEITSDPDSDYEEPSYLHDVLTVPDGGDVHGPDGSDGPPARPERPIRPPAPAHITKVDRDMGMIFNTDFRYELFWPLKYKN